MGTAKKLNSFKKLSRRFSTRKSTWMSCRTSGSRAQFKKHWTTTTSRWTASSKNSQTGSKLFESRWSKTYWTYGKKTKDLLDKTSNSCNFTGNAWLSWRKSSTRRSTCWKLRSWRSWLLTQVWFNKKWQPAQMRTRRRKSLSTGSPAKWKMGRFGHDTPLRLSRCRSTTWVNRLKKQRKS